MNMPNYEHRRWPRRFTSLFCAFFGTAFLLLSTGTAQAETDASYGRLITTCAVAINPQTHKVYAVDEDANQLVVMDERSGSTHMVTVGQGPIALAIIRRTNRVYVVNANSNSVSVIDGKHDQVIATIKIRPGSNPYVLAADEATNKIYLANTYSDSLIVIDGATNAVTRFKTGSADGIIIDPRSNTIFLMTYESPDIRIVDASTGAMTKVGVGAHLWGMAFDQANDTLYLGHTDTGDVVELNVHTRAVHTITVGSIPCAVGVNSRTQRLYAVNYGSETVSVINLKTNKVIASLLVGKHPQDVRVDALHNRIYVANVHGNSVTAIDGANNKIIGTYSAGENPYALALDPIDQKVFAANFGQPAVTEVNVSQVAEN